MTNHAVVAMIEEDVKQTRCTTCDAEHAYKGGREPRRRKKDATSVLYREVLAGMPDVDVPASAEPAEEAPETAPFHVEADNGNGNGHETHDVSPDPSDAPPADDETRAADPVEEGPIHRRLIRATLPRPEGQKTERQIPDFTIRSNGPFRGDRARARGLGGPGGNGNGNSAGHRRGRRFAGGPNGAGRPGGHGMSGGGRPGFGGGAPAGHGRSRGRKRSR
ncbi:MAG TPA: hypothetical protein VM364_07055 [Vicinamibacterales bacterium]|nr:hypothetical protein [Vicinamibacterales bacterium]